MSGGESPSRRKHWARVHASREPDTVSWYQRRPVLSLEMIEGAARPPARVIDVGGGASFLVDRLLERGFRVGVLDLAQEALEVVQARLGPDAGKVEWFVDDVTEYVSPHPWDVWHDRAVFHFLTEPEERFGYRKALVGATLPGSNVIIATFGPDGPRRCSGLSTMRYAPDELSEELDEGFRLLETRWERHPTPGGAVQQFVYCRFLREG